MTSDISIPQAVPGTDGLPPLWFVAPEGFFALPLDATPEGRAERASALVRELYSRGDESIWESAAPYYAAMGELMASTGLSYSALGLFSTAEHDTTSDTDEERRYEPAEGVAHCAFTVGIIPTDHSEEDTDVVAQGILATLSGDPYNNAIWVDLPCGPAVSCITLREYPLNPEATNDSKETKLLTGQIQVHVPFPTGPYTAVFTLNTPSMDYWTEIYHLMSAILRTVSFDDPLAQNSSG
ncbi:hypothetical protein [Streptomyces sp. MH60]|uniref:hypothetical protein n=1 Tax=Streptomyces sp. MH60 TaxID=1940758 RepID=UPI000D4496B8|nr:hypothetical protein [Streptomyces sp. MH60]PPS87893.1 hypothetical protein BZZ08_02592 [Streptomyces sp. MH60]